MVVDLANTTLLVVVSIALPMTASSQALDYGDFLAGDWDIHIVDHDDDAGRHSYITLNGHGYPHISYSSHDYIRFAKWDGSKWNTETVEEGIHIGGSHSHDLDSRGFPHLAYYDTHEGLKYAKWNGTGWVIDVLDSGQTIGTASLAIDASDHPHISFYDKGDSSLKYMFWDGSKWNIDTVDSPIDKFSVSMALDSSGLPHISYCASVVYGGLPRLHYAKWDGSSWNIEVPDTTTRACVQRPTSISLDSKDLPHISYFDVTNEDLKYTRWNGTAWFLDTVDTGLVGEPSSIAVDKHDNPHIAYTSSGLRYARWDGNRWNIERVVSAGFPSLAIDRNDSPHISCFRAGLGYATKPPPPPERDVSLLIDPDTLNLKSEGRWITAYLTTKNAKAWDINPLSLKLNDVIGPEWWSIQNDTTLMVKFNRSAVQTIVPISDEVIITVTGRWKDGERFEMQDTIRVIGPGPYLEAPDPISFRDMSPEYSRIECSVIAPIGEPREGLRVGFRT